MTVARTLIRAFALSGQPSPARVLQRVNRSLLFDSPDGLYVTAIYTILHLEEGRIEFANAGHNWPLILRANGDVETLSSSGTALGILSQIRLENQTALLLPGDFLLLYTDGLTEMFSEEGEVFGETRFIHTVRNAPRFSAEALVEHIKAAIEGFRGSAPPSDDSTLLVIHRKGNSGV
jgi:sigma-B regulation protein RsbU (phosphoserine phosphatase)